MDFLIHQFESLQTLFLLAIVIVHFALATGKARDIGLLIRQGKTTWLVSGVWWVFSTLLTGIIAVLAYWLIHHSTLVRQDKISIDHHD